jgi:CubicO group peptidase (beta-lactamase class C family)
MSLRLPPTLALALLLAPAGSRPAPAQADFRAVAGLTAREYQEWFERTAAAGYRLDRLSGCDAGGEPRFFAVAVKDAGVAWEARHDLSAGDFRAASEGLAKKGFRPVSVSGYLAGTAPRFAGVWVKDARPLRSEMHLDLTARQYQDRVDALGKRGLRPDVVSGYADGAGSYRFAALFVEAAGPDWLSRHDLAPDDFQKAFEEWGPRGYRPTSVSAYPTEAGLRFAATFVKDPARWGARHGLSPEECRAEIDRRARDGFRPLCVVGWAEGKAADFEAFDAPLRKYMKERNIPAGTLAVSRGGRLLGARGYGFADAAGRRPVRPEDPFRIASISKPITAAAIRNLVRKGRLSLDTRVFPLLGMKPPPGRRPDPRLDEVTVEHLLEHKGGWDQDRTFDPMIRPLEVAAALGKPGPAGPDDVVRYMIGQPLQFAPGSARCYSNFGYCVLGRVIEKVTGQSYISCIRDKLLAPLGIRSVELARSLPGDRNPREPVYLDPDRGRNVLRPRSTEPVPAPDGNIYLEGMDAHGGLIASAVDLTRFLDAYWVTGEPRRGEARAYTHFGSLPGTFGMAMQRPNGVSVAALFNQRTDPSGLDYHAIEDLLREVADRVSAGEVRCAVVWLKEE